MVGKPKNKASKGSKNNSVQGEPMPDQGRSDPSPENPPNNVDDPNVVVPESHTISESRSQYIRNTGTSPEREPRQSGPSRTAARGIVINEPQSTRTIIVGEPPSPPEPRSESEPETMQNRMVRVESDISSMKDSLKEILAALGVRKGNADKGKGIDPSERRRSRRHVHRTTIRANDGNPGESGSSSSTEDDDDEEARQEELRRQEREAAAERERQHRNRIRQAIEDYDRRTSDMQRDLIRQYEPDLQSELRAHVSRAPMATPVAPAAATRTRRDTPYPRFDAQPRIEPTVKG